MAAGPTWASSLQILVLLFGAAVLIHESIGGNVLPGYKRLKGVCSTWIRLKFDEPKKI